MFLRTSFDLQRMVPCMIYATHTYSDLPVPLNIKSDDPCETQRDFILIFSCSIWPGLITCAEMMPDSGNIAFAHFR